MSFNMEVFLVDINEINHAIGSNNTELLDTIMTEYADEMEENDEWFQYEMEDGIPSSANALAELINGQCSAPEYSEIYIFALTLLCRELGKTLDNDLFVDFHTSWLDALEIVEPFLNSEQPPLELPFDWNAEEMMIGYISPQKANDILKILQKINIESQHCTEQVEAVENGTFNSEKFQDDATVDEEVLEGRKTFMDWLRQASEKNRSILTFTM